MLSISMNGTRMLRRSFSTQATRNTSESTTHLLSRNLPLTATINRLYLDQLQTSRRHLDSLLQDADTNLNLLTHLSKTFDDVEAQASAFQARCESLLADQRRLSSLADDVGENLQFYNYLDPITRRLNAPGVRHFVRSDDFTEMLSQLDECLEYMKVHVSPSRVDALARNVDKHCSLISVNPQRTALGTGYCLLVA